MPTNSASEYFDRLTEIYLDPVNDENAKSTRFRTVLEDFFHDYIFPEQPDSMTFAQLQQLWYQQAGNYQLNRLISEIRIDLNHITHEDKSIRGNKGYLMYMYRACVTILMHLSGEDPGNRTRVACGEAVRDYLNNLNEQQRDIVIDDSRIVYVNAGPGTGKTHLLVYKIVDLLATLKREAKIVALSYTRTSARSLSSKLDSTLSKLNMLQDSIPYSGTIHSYCLNSLRSYRSQKGEKFDYIIADETEIEEIVDDIFYSLDGEVERESIAKAIKKPDDSMDPRILAAIAERKDVYKRISVGEILSVYLNEIATNDDFVEWSRKNMNVILVDEAQDLTIENYQIFDILLEKIPDMKLFLVGDPRQNIFGFLGGSFDNLDQFLKKYENQISRKALSFSYRCPQKILDFTNAMSFSDCDNIHLTSNSEEPGSITLNYYDNEYDEAKATVEFIKQRGAYNSVAILSSKIKTLGPIVDELNAQGIRFVVQGGGNSLKPYIHAFACMNRLVETKLKALGTANKLCARLEIPKCKTMPEFLNTEVGKEIKKLGSRYEAGNIQFIELERGFVKLCRQYFNSASKDEMDADFQRLYTMVIVKSDSPKGFSYHFKHYHKQFISLDADFKSTGTTEDAVTLSTIHSAKGLEWDCVIMPCMCDHLFPDPKRQEDVDPDERHDGINTDKKLMFVAVTRSKKDLILSYPCMIRDSKMQARPSRLLGSLMLL